MPIILWPLLLIFGIVLLISVGTKRLFDFLAIYLFKVPRADTDAVHADDGGGAFLNTLPTAGTGAFTPSMQNRGGTNPPPTTPKPDVTPPSQVAMMPREEVPRTDLIDID